MTGVIDGVPDETETMSIGDHGIDILAIASSGDQARGQQTFEPRRNRRDLLSFHFSELGHATLVLRQSDHGPQARQICQA